MGNALLLDFDGVIVDSEGVQLRAVNLVLAPYGIELNRETWIEHCVGHKARDILGAHLAGRVNPPEIERLLVAKSETYRDLSRLNAPEARPGIPELIERARARGFRCGIASATPEADIRVVVESLGLASDIDAIVSSDAVPRPKPAPDVYLRAAELLGVSPTQCIVVEDTPIGLEAGREAGMFCAAFPNEWTAALDFSTAHLLLTILSSKTIDQLLSSVA